MQEHKLQLARARADAAASDTAATIQRMEDIITELRVSVKTLEDDKRTLSSELSHARSVDSCYS